MKVFLLLVIPLLVILAQTQMADATIVGFDKKTYTWTSQVKIKVYGPDFNSDPNLIDTIGVSVSTSGHILSPYKLVETGTNTGIFAGSVILTGDPSIKGSEGVDGLGTNPTGLEGGVGPTDGFLPAENNDGVTVSFAYNRDQTITGSALLQWNVGQIQWLKGNYSTNEQGVLQVTDPDMNLNPKTVDKFETNVWSDSDSGGTKISMIETGKDTGVFEGQVYFTTESHSSPGRLHVTQGDTITGEYVDRTPPYPHSTSDQLHLTATTISGDIISPLEKITTSNPKIVNSLGNALSQVKVNQQVLVSSDIQNFQQQDQPFVYLVQIEDSKGVTLSLSWITGTLVAGQFLNLAESWMPTSTGEYNAQIFVWQSLSEPNALSPSRSTTITVS